MGDLPISQVGKICASLLFFFIFNFLMEPMEGGGVGPRGAEHLALAQIHPVGFVCLMCWQRGQSRGGALDSREIKAQDKKGQEEKINEEDTFLMIIRPFSNLTPCIMFSFWTLLSCLDQTVPGQFFFFKALQKTIQSGPSWTYHKHRNLQNENRAAAQLFFYSSKLKPLKHTAVRSIASYGNSSL